MTEPRWLTIAKTDIGLREAPGDENNPDVVRMYAEAGHPEVKEDSTAWCAAALGSWLYRAGIKPSGSLLARSYLKWGAKLTTPRKGCVVVLWRGSPDADTGHVGLWISETEDKVNLLGGNQGNSVCIEGHPKDRVLGYRWPLEDKKMNTDAGTTISKTVTGTNLTVIIVGVLVAALNMTSEGSMILHAVSVIAGIIAAGAGALNQFHITGLTNENTLIKEVGEIASEVKSAIDAAENK